VTIPKAVRDALGIKQGDEVVFRIDGNRAVMARTPDFLTLAGTIKVPAAKRNVAWDDVIRKTRRARCHRPPSERVYRYERPGSASDRRST